MQGLLRRVDLNSQYVLCTSFFADKKRIIIPKSENKIKFEGHGQFKEVRDHFSKWLKKSSKDKNKTEKLQKFVYKMHFLDQICTLNKYLPFTHITVVIHMKQKKIKGVWR